MNERLQPDSAGAAKVFASPNHGPRRHADGTEGRRPDMLILHYTGMADAGQALQWLCNPVSNVSSHYFVFENGHVLQLVPEARRAWHAGVSHWQGDADINSCSIGIEIANPGHPGGLPPYPVGQISAVLELCRDICERWSIRPDRVLAHSDVAPGRKIDPGELFPWRRLAAEGLVPPLPDAARVAAQRAVYEAALPDAAWFQQQLRQLIQVPWSSHSLQKSCHLLLMQKTNILNSWCLLQNSSQVFKMMLRWMICL